MKPARINRTIFDKYANISFFLTAPPLLVAFLTNINKCSIDMQRYFVFCALICEVVGFILGVVSLFGHRIKRKSFPLALFGTLVGGVSGLLFLFALFAGGEGIGG